jgi:hypothetical protein
MKDIYKKLWELAKPFYEKGRSYDIPHVEWMMGEADRISKIENLNEDLLLPIVVLHDVGYSMAKNRNPRMKCKDSKRKHMNDGAKIAGELLEKIGYNPNLTKKIVRYISVHDNWIFGDDKPFKECREMGIFNDLDFIWAVSSLSMFEHGAKSMGMKTEEMYDFWLNDEKLVRRPFSSEETNKMFDKFMAERRQEVEKITNAN